MRHHESCSQIYIYTILSTIKQRFLENLLQILITLNNSLNLHRLSTSARIICLLSTEYFWHDDDVTPSICIVWSEWFILSFEFV